MISRILAALLIWSVAWAAAAQVNALPPTRHILVYGDAKARALPDRFKITINFDSIDLSAENARARVESSLQQVLTQLKAANVSDNEIVATALQIATYRHYDRKLEEQVFGGTQVKRSLSARFFNQDDLKKFLATVNTSKELTISSVATELSDEKALRSALREKTIEESKKKAETIAKAYGVRLGGLYSVSDVAPQFDYGVREGSWDSTFQWTRQRGYGGAELDRVAAAPNMAAQQAESFQTGYMNFDDKIYTVFLIEN